MPSSADAFDAAKKLVPGLTDFASLLASFASAFTQHTRLLKLHFSSDAGIPPNVLLPHHLTGHEGINQSLRYELDVLCNDASFDLKTLIGVPVQVSILSDEGQDRTLCGIVTEAHQKGSDGGFGIFGLVIEDGLSILRLSRTARVAMDVNVLDWTDRILKAHLEANSVLAAALTVDNRCQGTYPERPFWMQYNETDFDYLCRIWAREGISWVIVSAEDSTPDHPQHTLILFDDGRDLEVNASERVRFHRADSTESHDSVTEWAARRVLQSGSIARSTWDHVSATASFAAEESNADQGSQGSSLAGTLEDYRHEAPLEGDGVEGFASNARRRMEAREGWGEGFEGGGSVRHFSSGSWFTLVDHPVHNQDDNRDFVLVGLDVEAVNNLPKDLSKGLGGLLEMGKDVGGLLGQATRWGSKGGHGELSEQAVPSSQAGDKVELPYRNRFVCVRRGSPLVADEITPPNPGILTATVVGPGGEVVHTNGLGQVKVQFHLARSKDHPLAGASGSDGDSAWVRQVESWGSQGFGGNFIPRVGDEVLVAFLGGDPDRPVIIGSVSNGARPVTSFGEVSGLPGDKALSGFRSNMLGGSGGNEMLLDDTPNELRAKLHSDHTTSQLQLGNLVHPRKGGQGEPRGEGFDLRTDAYGAVRADKGMLLSTTGASGDHCENGDLTEQVQSSLDLSKALSDASSNHQAAKLDAMEASKKLKTSLEKTQKAGSGKVAAFDAPILALTSPAGIASGTPSTHAISAGENIHIISGKDTNLGVGGKLSMAIMEAWSVFVAKAGFKIFAGKADIAIQAHEGNINFVSEKNTTLTSCTTNVEMAAKNTLTMCAGGGKVELTGGNINITVPGNVTIKAKVNIKQGEKAEVEMPKLPKEGEFYGRQYVLLHEKTGEPLIGVRYEITTKEGNKIQGITNEQGHTQMVASSNPDDVEIHFLDSPQTHDHP